MKWNTGLYDQQHGFVSKYGEELIDLLNPQPGEQVLDLGSGTGDLAAIISNKGAIVTGLDSSAEMVETARNKYPELSFDCKPAEDFSYDQQFDAIFSNATLHWVTEYKEAAHCIYNALAHKGRFVAEFGGKGNVAGIITALQNALIKHGLADTAAKQVWYFPSLSEYSSLLEATGFRVIWAAHFDRPTLLKEDKGIQNWLLQFAQPYLQSLSKETTAGLLQEVEEALRPTHFREANWYADYVRLRVVAIKE